MAPVPELPIRKPSVQPLGAGEKPRFEIYRFGWLLSRIIASSARVLCVSLMVR